jgi:hypothetical protein
MNPQIPPIQPPAATGSLLATMAAQSDAPVPQPVYESMVKSIIEAQEAVIGPIAVSRAQQVAGLHIDWSTKTVNIDGDPAEVVDRLVKQYSILFGQISVEVCKEAAARYSTQVSGESLPHALRK